MTIVTGQIAHIDRNSENNKFENLVFLCLEHHDQYDSQSRQSKRFSNAEVSIFRDELYRAVNIEFQPQQANQAPQSITQGKVEHRNTISGKYIRIDGDENARAEIEINSSPISPEKIHVRGFAVWGTNRSHGPNIGELEFLGELFENKLVFREQVGLQESKSIGHTVEITFGTETMNVREEFWVGVHGLNVTFEGTYVKIT